MASFTDIFNTVAPTGLAVLSEVKGRGRNSKRQRIIFGIRVMQILAAIRNTEGGGSDLCLQTINELGVDVRAAILKGYKENKGSAPVPDDDITKAL